VFTTNGRSVSGFSQGKNRLDAPMLVAKRAECGDRTEAIPDWILHDLRRTAARSMARLNIPPHVVDKVLNHASGTLSAVWPQFITVLNIFGVPRWRHGGRYVAGLVTPTAPNVVALLKP
jgi:hypothetical protein